MLVIAIGSASGGTNQSKEISNQENVAVCMQPVFMQFPQEQTPIIQPTGITSTQSGKPSVVGSDVQITTFTEADSHPWVEVDNNGNPMVVYDHDTGLGYHEIYMQRSPDGGATWPVTQRYYLAGTPNLSAINPVIELTDNGTLAIVLFQTEQQPDPALYSVMLFDIDNPTTWVFGPSPLWENSTWCGETSIDLVENQAYIMSYISDFITIPYHDAWYMMATNNWSDPYSFSGLLWYSTDPNTKYYHPTTGAGTSYFYAAAQFSETARDSVVLCWCQRDNISYLNWKSSQIVYTNHHITNPDLAVSGEYAYVTMQSDQTGNNDILCYTPPSVGTNWLKHIVASSSDDEMYPSITAVGKTALCTFVKNSGLYMSKSIDGGVTWSDPEQINDITAQLIGEYRCSNVKGPFGVWMDNRNANIDIYTHVNPMPWIVLMKCSGGLGCKVEIANVGTADATTIEWNMQVHGGLKGQINVTSNGTIDVAAGKTAKAKSKVFFGFGQIFITASAGGAIIEKEGKQFLIFSMVKK